MVVLAVADEAIRRQYVASLAESEFTTVDTARGDDVLALAKRLLPDFVVLDFDLPGMHALDLIRQLRAEATTMHAGILALSRGVTPYRESVASQAGCDVLLESPCPPETLLTELLVLFAQFDAASEHLRAAKLQTPE